jgi:hypothetical protein
MKHSELRRYRDVLAGWQGIYSRQAQSILLVTASRPALGYCEPPIHAVPRVLSRVGVSSGRGVKLMYNATYYAESQQSTFRKNMSPLTFMVEEEAKQEASECRWQAVALLVTCCPAGHLLGSFLDHEDGGDMFLRNVTCLSTQYTTLCPRELKPP